MARAYDYLSRPIRQYIYERGWHALNAIQTASICACFERTGDLILAAPTASGKTEAAFLPAISQVDDWHDGVKILAISPMIALINDQFQRIEQLCEALGIPITAWHGEANRQGKMRLLKAPAGIVLITPESVEAMLDRHPEQARALFSRLEWLFVDELHSFLGTSRGVQLQSLIRRLMHRSGCAPRCIGMSATIAPENYSDCKAFFGNADPATILLDRRMSDPETAVWRHDAEDEQAMVDLIYAHSLNENMLIFPNSRRRVEELVNGLKRRAERDGRSVSFFAHHSSVEKALRQAAEAFAKRPSGRFSICCTSTLELGVDIGAVDAVTQVEAPFSVSGLAQRLGRSGRVSAFDAHTGKTVRRPSRLYFHSLSDWQFLQGVAAIELLRRGELDAVRPVRHPYDVLAHQILAMVLSRSGMTATRIVEAVRGIPAFQAISDADIGLILTHFLSEDYLEAVPGSEPELIIGLGAERIVNRRDFYAMFMTAEEYTVSFGAERIGRVPLTPEIAPGARLLLAGRVWRIDAIDARSRRIQVGRAQDGKAPTFGGSGGDVSEQLRRGMLAILADPPRRYLEDPKQAEIFARLRERFGRNALLQPVSNGGRGMGLVCFAGTAIERTLYLYLHYALREREHPNLIWSMAEGILQGEDLEIGMKRIRRELDHQGRLDFDGMTAYLEGQPVLMGKLLAGVKYAFLLPDALRAAYVRRNLCDEALAEILRSGELRDENS